MHICLVGSPLDLQHNLPKPMSNQIKSASSHFGCLLTRRGCSHGVFDFVKKPVLLEPPYIPFPASFSAAKTRSRTPPGRFPDISPTLVCVLVPSEVRLKAVWAVLDPRLGCFRTILVVFGVSGTNPGPTGPPISGMDIPLSDGSPCPPLLVCIQRLATSLHGL